MSSENPFRTAERDAQNGTQRSGQQAQNGQTRAPQNGQRQPPRGGQQRPAESVDPGRVEELEQQVEDLQNQLEEEDGEEKPEPDFECPNDDCEGFAVEEVEAEHVTTSRTITGDTNRPVLLECPRCGEEIRCTEIVPKEEQKTSFGRKPLMSNDDAASRALREKFEEHGREDVLEEAECRWRP